MSNFFSKFTVIYLNLNKKHWFAKIYNILFLSDFIFSCTKLFKFLVNLQLKSNNCWIRHCIHLLLILLIVCFLFHYRISSTWAFDIVWYRLSILRAYISVWINLFISILREVTHFQFCQNWTSAGFNSKQDVLDLIPLAIKHLQTLIFQVVYF